MMMAIARTRMPGSACPTVAMLVDATMVATPVWVLVPRQSSGADIETPVVHDIDTVSGDGSTVERRLVRSPSLLSSRAGNRPAG